MKRRLDALRRARRYLLGFLAGALVAGLFAANRYPWDEAADRRCLRYALHYILLCQESCHHRGEGGEVTARTADPERCCVSCRPILDSFSERCRVARFIREHAQYRIHSQEGCR